MESQAKTIQLPLPEMTLLKDEIGDLGKTGGNQNKHDRAIRLERELYLDLSNALPSGIYRLRVFHEVGTIEEKWSSLDDAPYIIEFVNDRFCEILNLDKHTFEKTPGIINHLIFEADKAEFFRKNVEANLYTIPFKWEGRFIIKDQMIWVHFESIPRVLENKDIIWTGILYDISELKKAEQELKSINQELQKVNAEKDRFFSIIAHDLKSPFNSILGFSNILLESAQEEDLESIKKYAQIISHSSQSAMNLLTNLMQWSQSQTGRMNFIPEYFILGDIIDEIVLLSTDIAVQKSITITNDSPSEITVYADKAMIGTVIRNLVSNAIKFTTPGGRVTISAEATQDEVRISISDTGVGISKPVLEKILHIDSNCSTPDTQGEKGTGLGLILCKEFIEKHGGKIGVESEPGKGSVFHFTIPCPPNVP